MMGEITGACKSCGGGIEVCDSCWIIVRDLRMNLKTKEAEFQQERERVEKMRIALEGVAYELTSDPIHTAKVALAELEATAEKEQP